MGSTTRGAELSVHHTMLARAGRALAAIASALVVTIAAVAIGLTRHRRGRPERQGPASPAPALPCRPTPRPARLRHWYRPPALPPATAWLSARTVSVGPASG